MFFNQRFSICFRVSFVLFSIALPILSSLFDLFGVAMLLLTLLFHFGGIDIPCK